MLLFFKRILVVMTLAAALCQSSFGFALLGPRDTWQIAALGYDPQSDLGDLGGPKNLGEEWRWVLPRISYAFDPSFIDFFGTNGIAAVEEAISLFNRELTNSLSGLTDAELLAKPLDTRRIHSTAQALGVLDLKSATMGMLAEQLGLASAERWTWALRDRQVFTQNVTNYLVIKRNFDPFTLRPSSYVNGRRLTYTVGVFPALVGVFYEDAVEFPIDQAGDGPFMGSTVSSMVGEDLTGVWLRPGEYFSSLTQDDIGGLRYIYRRNNVNAEVIPQPARDIATFPPSLRVTNQLTFISGFDAFSFFTNALLTDPTNLTTQFTNLIILQTNVTFTNISVTNLVLTNLVAGGLFTNTALPMLITNLDLYVFSEASRTNPPPQLLGLYPQLIITSTNSGFESTVQEVYFLGEDPLGSPFDPPVIMTNYVTNLLVNYRYTFQNVITNYASTVTDLEVRDIEFVGAPGDFELFTNVTRFRTNRTSGGFYILDRSTNASLVGHAFVDQNRVPLMRATNVIDSVTNQVFFFTNIFDPTDIRRRDVVNKFTNVVYAVYPILLNSAAGQAVVPVVTTILTNRFEYVFDTNNLIFFPPANGNTNVILQTIIFTNGAPRIIEQFIDVGLPQGTVVIIDTNFFILADPRLVPPVHSFGLVTNIITSFTNTATGQFITQQLIFQTNSILVGVFPITYVQQTVPTLRAGVDSIKFEPLPYLEFLSQTNAIATNFYNITAQVGTNIINQTVRRISGADIVFSTSDFTSVGAFPISISRSLFFQIGNTVIAPGGQFDRGPGQIVGGSTISFSKLTPSWILQTPGATTEETAVLFLQWGSFDSETLLPRLYPEDITGQLKTLEDIVLRRIPPPAPSTNSVP
jgi:hypothetical protein